MMSTSLVHKHRQFPMTDVAIINKQGERHKHRHRDRKTELKAEWNKWIERRGEMFEKKKLRGLVWFGLFA